MSAPLTKEEEAMGDDSLPVSMPASPTPPAETPAVSWGEFMDQEVDTDIASFPLSAYSFMTGYVDAISFTACFIWCAFQTGNTIQLALALARLFTGEHRGEGFLMPDRQAFTSLGAFLVGAFFGRIGDYIGPRKRLWLVLGTIIQALFTLASCLCAHFSGQNGFAADRGSPSWTNTLGFWSLAFASASMGLQAHTGTRLGSQFATTVVLTTIWVQFVSEPKLFKVNHVHKSREYKALAVFSLFLGGLIGRALVNTIGTPRTLAIGAGIRGGIALSWLAIPRKAPKV